MARGFYISFLAFAILSVSDSILLSQDQSEDHARDVVYTNLGDKINTKYSDYVILYSGDLSTMVFTRYEKRRDAVYASYYEDGVWTDPVDISEQIGSQGDMYASALSYDGKELYLIMLTSFDTEIMVSSFENGKWSYAKNIGAAINSRYFEANVCISADGNTLFFSSDRASSLGGLDLFTSQKVDGKWQKAVNMGEVINTKANEESPAIVDDGQTLYFSSDRKGTMGKMDIYFSRKEGDAWAEPENLGVPFNTEEDDISFKYYPKYRKGYIARDLPEGFGKLDLYLIQSEEDRQREIADYEKSLIPIEPALVETPDTMPETDELLAYETASEPEVKMVTEPNLNVAPPPVAVPVAEVSTAIIVPEIAKDDEPVKKEFTTPDIKPGSVDIPEPETPKAKELEPPTTADVPKMVEEPKPQKPTVYKKPDSDNKIEEPAAGKVKVEFSGIYTVQIVALMFPKRIEYFTGLELEYLRSFKGDDGFTRYLYGQYSTPFEAQVALRTAIKRGYPDAFIRKTSDVSNFE